MHVTCSCECVRLRVRAHTLTPFCVTTPPHITGGVINPTPGAEDAKRVIQIPVGLPCLERGRLAKKKPSREGDLFLLCTLPSEE